MGVHGLINKVLVEIGIKPERFSLKWASAAEAPRFVRLIREFTQQVKELGPLGQAEGFDAEEVKKRIDKGLQLVSNMKLRVAFGNVTKTLRKEGSQVNDTIIADLIDEKLSKTIATNLGE
jgi:hypothetical protein